MPTQGLGPQLTFCFTRRALGGSPGCAAQDLVEELVAPHWYVDRKGETPPGKKEFYKQPIFNYHQVLHLVHDKQQRKVVSNHNALVVSCSGLGLESEACMTVQGFLSSPYTATYYTLAQRHPEVPLLTQKQHEALRLYNALALSDRLRLDLMLQPGDIQLLSNHTQLHTALRLC